MTICLAEHVMRHRSLQTHASVPTHCFQDFLMCAKDKSECWYTVQTAVHSRHSLHPVLCLQGLQEKLPEVHGAETNVFAVMGSFSGQPGRRPPL